MTHTIDEIEHYVEGDSLLITYNIVTQDGTPKDLSGSTIAWELVNNGFVLHDTSESSISLTVTNATDGEFKLELLKNATKGLSGTYTTRITITDPNDNQQTWHGKLQIIDR